MPESDTLREASREYTPRRVMLTYEDYCRMPSGNRYELVEGDIRMTPSPSVFHQRISRRIEKVLLEWVERHELGEVLHAPIDVVLSEHNVVQPDILYVARERLGIIKEANIQGAPDLVVEILSPSDAEWDRVTKRRVYARFGVREFWIVGPEGRNIEVCVFRDCELKTFQVYPPGTRLSSPLLNDFTLDVAEVFREVQA